MPNEIWVLPDRRQNYFFVNIFSKVLWPAIKNFVSFFEEREDRRLEDCGIYILAIVAKKMQCSLFLKRKKRFLLMIRKVSFVTNELLAAPRFSLLFQLEDVVWSHESHSNGDSPHSCIDHTNSSKFRFPIKYFQFSHRMDPQQPNNGSGPLSKTRGSTAVFAAFLWSLSMVLSTSFTFTFTYIILQYL